MVSTELIDDAAKRLREAAANRTFCSPIRDLIGDQDINAAYAVQQVNSDLRIKEGGIPVGHKIGLTASVVQKQLGVDQPDFGLLWQDTQVINGGDVSMLQLMQPKAEAEIAFVLEKDLDMDTISLSRVANSVAYLTTSIEIVGSRILDWDIKITDTIADNASASHWVLGNEKVKLENVDLINCKMVMKNNDQVVTEGVGSACLGSPLNAVLWLARKMNSLRQPLKAGDIILSGSLGGMINAAPGDNFKVSIEGLGTAGVSFVK